MLIQTNLLKKALSKLIGIIPAKSTVPILENILFSFEEKRVNLTVSDLEISGTASLPCDGNIADFCVLGKRLYDTVKMIQDDEIEFILKEHGLTVKTLRGQYKLPTESPAEYPMSPKIEKLEKIECDNFIGKIGKVIYAVSNDQLRPSLSGVYVGKDVVATDGHCLSLVPFGKDKNGSFCPSGKEIIIPSKIMGIALKMDVENMGIAYNSNFIKLEAKDGECEYTLISKLVDETYPNYEAVLPKGYTSYLEVNRLDLLNSIRRLSLFSSSSTHQIKFSISDKFRIEATDTETGSEANEEVDAEINGEIEIGLNAQYVINTLIALKDEKIRLEYSDPIKAIVFKGEEHFCLVMPVRLNCQ